MKIFIMIIASFLFFTYGMGLLFTLQTAQAAKGKATYVGMARCKECHPKEVETYLTWKYSKNFRIIQMRKKDRDPNCLRCHTTGFGQPGGFRSVEKTPDMANKQCESCHGPASLHLKAPTKEEHQRTLTIPKNLCTTCHSGHRHPGWY